jgi:hypothetical protein
MNTFTIGQTKQDTEFAIALHQNAQEPQLTVLEPNFRNQLQHP